MVIIRIMALQILRPINMQCNNVLSFYSVVGRSKNGTHSLSDSYRQAEGQQVIYDNTKERLAQLLKHLSGLCF